MCKIVQKDAWSGLVENSSVTLLSAYTFGARVFEVKTTTYKTIKRELVLLEGGSGYKPDRRKKSRLEDNFKPV